MMMSEWHEYNDCHGLACTLLQLQVACPDGRMLFRFQGVTGFRANRLDIEVCTYVIGL